MADNPKPKLILRPRPDFVPKQGRVPKYVLKPRNHHTRARVNLAGNMRIRATEPEMCPNCHTPREESQPEEVFKEGKWWWHCRVEGCEYFWDPV